MEGLKGIFPHNLIGRVMKTFTEKGWPYPEEVCTFWNEAVDLAMKNAEVNSLSGYNVYDAEAELLAAMGLKGMIFIPEQWHTELEARKLRKQAQEAAKQIKLDAEKLVLEKPDPPRTAQIRVRFESPDGTIYYVPLLDIGPLLLKEDSNWKYHNTVNIPADKIPQVVTQLIDIAARLERDYSMPHYGTPTMAGKSSPSTA